MSTTPGSMQTPDVGHSYLALHEEAKSATTPEDMYSFGVEEFPDNTSSNGGNPSIASNCLYES